jgi:hypothetical protein
MATCRPPLRDSARSTAIWAVATAGVYAATRLWLWIHAQGFNLSLYAYFADVVSTGRNPYTMPDGTYAATYADYPPIWMALFGTLAQVVSGRTAVKIVAFAGDAVLCSVAVRLALRRSGTDRLATLALVVVNPMYLLFELYYTHFKSWLVIGLTVLSIAPSAVLFGALSGAFVLPAMLAPSMLYQRALSKRGVCVAACVAAIMWLPYLNEALPAVLYRRAHRASFGPLNENVTLLVDGQWRGVLLVAGFVFVGWMFWRCRTVLGGIAALGVIVALMAEASVERETAFVLPVMLAAETSGAERLTAYLACLVGLIGRTADVSLPIKIVLARVPIAFAIYLAIRSTNLADAGNQPGIPRLQD